MDNERCAGRSTEHDMIRCGTIYFAERSIQSPMNRRHQTTQSWVFRLSSWFMAFSVRTTSRITRSHVPFNHGELATENLLSTSRNFSNAVIM